MRNAAKIFLFVLISVLYLAESSFSAPIIQVDSTTYDFGSVKEGQHKSITFTIPVKNVGDEVLEIKDVRVSCGCTVVDNDSLIAPGKIGYIKPRINLKGMSGDIHKSITIMSNSEKDESLRLTLKAFLKQIISVSPNYIRLEKKNYEQPITVHVLSENKKLKINHVSFKARKHSGEKTPAWQSEVPVQIEYSLTDLDSTDEHDLNMFSLSLKPVSALQENQYGEFVFVTNIPQKKEMTVRGMIEPPAKKN